MEIKHLVADHIDQILKIQYEAYHDTLIEDKNSFYDKIIKFRHFCLGAFFEDQLLAYVISIPCDNSSLPAFNDQDAPVSQQPSFLYLHDLSIDHTARGQNISTMLLDSLIAIAKQHQLSSIKLISVQNTSLFWEKQGFKKCHCIDPLIADKVKSFGEDAIMMIRLL